MLLLQVMHDLARLSNRKAPVSALDLRQKQQRGLLKEQAKGRSRNRGVIPFKVNWARIEALETPYSRAGSSERTGTSFGKMPLSWPSGTWRSLAEPCLKTERAPESPEEIFLANPFLQWGSECIPTRERLVRTRSSIALRVI